MSQKATKLNDARILQAIYYVNNEIPDLTTEWLDQILAVCETAAFWAETAEQEDRGTGSWQKAEEKAREFWCNRADEGDHCGWERAKEVALHLRDARLS